MVGVNVGELGGLTYIFHHFTELVNAKGFACCRTRLNRWASSISWDTGKKLLTEDLISSGTTLYGLVTVVFFWSVS